MQKRFGIAAAVFVSLAAAPTLGQDDAPKAAASTDTIVVEISDLPNDEGQVGCSIYSKPDGFPSKSDKADERMMTKPKNKKARCAFEGVKPGAYAISVMHDADKNGELNTSFVGRPKEWWGVSNNVPAERFGPPKFEAAKFQYDGGQTVLRIKLQL